MKETTLKFLRLVAIPCLFALTLSCSKKPPPPAPPKIETLNLQVRTTSGVNQGRSVRMLVRRVNPKQFANEKYKDIVALAERPDDSVLADQLLRPLSKIHLRLPLEDGANVGVYFLFTRPQTNSWKVLVPGKGGEVVVEAGRGGVEVF